MTTKVRCQARNPETCPYHGIPIHEQYRSDITDVEQFLRSKEEENKVRQLKAGEQIPLKEMNASELVDELRRAAEAEEWLPEETLNSSIELAWILHSNQVRGSRGDFRNTPYIEHPLRNAVRLLRLGVKDKDVIVAAVLHDTIEDGSQDYLTQVAGKNSQPELVAREKLSHHIQQQYGTEILRLVRAVTNDYIADTAKNGITPEQKNATYLNHVKNSISNDPGVTLVKISDFIDNAMSLHHHTSPELEKGTVRRATKYLPVVDVFIHELQNTKLPLTRQNQNKLIQSMLIAKQRLKAIISKPANS